MRSSSFIIILIIFACLCACKAPAEFDPSTCPAVLYDELYEHYCEACSYYEIEEARAAARKAQKPLLIHFRHSEGFMETAFSWLLENDEKLWEIVREHYVFVQLYVDDTTVAKKKLWRVYNNVPQRTQIGELNRKVREFYSEGGVPFFVIAGPNGNFNGKKVVWESEASVRKFLKKYAR